jgi:hypothetical protein
MPDSRGKTAVKLDTVKRSSGDLARVQEGQRNECSITTSDHGREEPGSCRVGSRYRKTRLNVDGDVDKTGIVHFTVNERSEKGVNQRIDQERAIGSCLENGINVLNDGAEAATVKDLAENLIVETETTPGFPRLGVLR